MPRPRVPYLSLLMLAMLTAPPASAAEQASSSTASAASTELQSLFARGVTLAEQNKREQAIRVFTELAEKYPGLPEPYNNLAVLYADQGQYDKARSALESAIKTNPSYATAHENLGDIYAKLASDAYNKALQLDTASPHAQGKLALIKDLYSGNRNLAVASIAKPLPRIDPSLATNGIAADKPATRPADPSTASKAAETKPADVKPAETKPVESKPADGNIAATKPVTVAPNQDKPADQVQPGKPDQAAGGKASKSDRADTDAVNSSVRQWARAWAAKEVSAYLASYAGSFQVPGGSSRKEWEASRRQRIDKPGSIQVDISNLKIELQGNKAKATFRQSYRSGSLAQRTGKTLILVHNNGKWLIEQERTER